ncbi:hypothetical protein IC757_08065 [Wenzhouxiangella sp. AB-CW3]|uniref:hypothetical protein n=1 Tax=Wenzhouxiangella sp. AB-CW3 TaxID=2771012 RepID=UPI00168B6EEA|nr:hypothetical protein [Wenzhouxiangella sp. AB-CW3]QOC24045.1 hypothetical protein IC757_08065 [Wenzhouxiangella sp. AB-CW3]
MTQRRLTNIARQRLLEPLLRHRDLELREPQRFIPRLLRPCRVRILMVADGSLNFGDSFFGLSTLVRTLLDTPPGPWVTFEISLAHMGNGTLMEADGIKRRINNFRFDDSSHFSKSDYDQVWLFGILTSYASRNDNDEETLTSAELDVLHEFMDDGGGVFATGDHGALGRAMCSGIKRVRGMRLWEGDENSTVSMAGATRNDTNVVPENGEWATTLETDHIPQRIQPKLYTFGFGITRRTYPHPLLCGPDGRITAMPDHPHEGECVLPGNEYASDFPGESDSDGPWPEIISQSTVEEGLGGQFKDPTNCQVFGGICAYDGHDAEVGRVVTDATWHHFVNYNLNGFIGDDEGEAALDQIQHYYRNLAVWLSPSNMIRCMNRRKTLLILLRSHVVEAVSSRSHPRLQQLSTSFIWDVGVHARDVLGREASQCQAFEWMLDLIRPNVPDLVLDVLHPWRRKPRPIPSGDPIPWINLEPMAEIGFGGALLAVHEQLDKLDPKRLEKDESQLDKIMAQGVSEALRKATPSLAESVKALSEVAGRIR